MGGMRRRTLLTCLLVTAAALPASAPARPTQQQSFLRTALLKDPKVTSAVKSALRRGRARVDARSGFVDLTGDDKSDAIALVTTGGAGGTIALYVLSTDGAKALRPVLRLQQVYRATVRVVAADRKLTVIEPDWVRGDALSDPTGQRERDYVWTPSRKTFRRTAVRSAPREG